MRCRGTRIGQEAETPVTVAEDELRRLARVVRHRVRMDLQIADREGKMAVDERDERNHRARRTDRIERAVREIDRNLVAPREPRDTAGVVVVLVGDEDCREIGGRETETREAPFGLSHVETAVDEYPGRSGLDDE